jgi:hypothetical protein
MQEVRRNINTWFADDATALIVDFIFIFTVDFPPPLLPAFFYNFYSTITRVYFLLLILFIFSVFPFFQSSIITVHSSPTINSIKKEQSGTSNWNKNRITQHNIKEERRIFDQNPS